jgi:hypothetical protein
MHSPQRFRVAGLWVTNEDCLITYVLVELPPLPARRSAKQIPESYSGVFFISELAPAQKMEGDEIRRIDGLLPRNI